MTFLLPGSGVITTWSLSNGGTIVQLLLHRRSRIWNRICSRLYTGGIAGQVLQSAAGAAPIWKTLEMTDIPGAAYKATCRVASTANITTLSGLLTIDGIVLVANDRVS
jgi:hypothetical protein